MQITSLWLRATTATFVISLLAACASVPKVEMDKSASRSIKKIAVLEVAPPTVQVENSVGAGLYGLIGAAIQSSRNADNTKTFVGALNAQQASFAQTMADSLVADLRVQGIEATYYPAKRSKRGADGKTADYSEVVTDDDAILDVQLRSFGYYSSPQSTDYVPRMIVAARLLDAKSRKVIYFRALATGLNISVEGATIIEAPSSAKYPSFDALMGGLGGAVEALHTTEKHVAARIAKDVKGE